MIGLGGKRRVSTGDHDLKSGTAVGVLALVALLLVVFLAFVLLG